MFERFTDRARRVVVLANEEARLLQHHYIGTEHILLGILHEGRSIAVQALGQLNVTLERTRAEVEEIIGLGANPSNGHLPFTPRAKKVLEFSLREALQLGHNHIGPEHILLGLAREGEGVAAQAWVKIGVDTDQIKPTVLTILSGEPQLSPSTSPRPTEATQQSRPAGSSSPATKAQSRKAPPVFLKLDPPPSDDDLSTMLQVLETVFGGNPSHPVQPLIKGLSDLLDT